MSKGSWRVKPTEIARIVNAVKSTGMPVHSIEYSIETNLLRFGVGASEKDQAIVSSGDEENSTDLRKLL
jgi:hypothetical protein